MEPCGATRRSVARYGARLRLLNDAVKEYYVHGGAKNERAVATILRSLRIRGELGAILDIGCAHGTLLVAVAPLARSVSGVDMSADAIAEAHKRLPGAALAAADVQTKLPFPDAFFDTVFMLDVLEHLARPADAMKEISRVLSVGGTLVLSTPNANSPIRWLKGDRWFGVRDPGHVLLYTRFTLLYLLRVAGFKILRTVTEPFTGTAADTVLRKLRVGGTLLVLAQKESELA